VKLSKQNLEGTPNVVELTIIPSPHLFTLDVGPEDVEQSGFRLSTE
jgi:hypothetical protein